MRSECRVLLLWATQKGCLGSEGAERGPGHWRVRDKKALRATHGDSSVFPQISTCLDLPCPNVIVVFPIHLQVVPPPFFKILFLFAAVQKKQTSETSRSQKVILESPLSYL